MQNFEALIFILTVLIALFAIAGRFKLPTPMLLVLAGLAMAFVPGMPLFALDPDVVFLIFLPPVLYDAASRMSWRDFRQEIKPISPLAIALVFFTTTTVAVAAHVLIPGFTCPLRSYSEPLFLLPTRWQLLP